MEEGMKMLKEAQAEGVALRCLQGGCGEVEQEAEELLHRLFSSLTTEILPKLLSEEERKRWPELLFPVVEQHLMDYELHLRGAPDLVLECRQCSGGPKAVVVEWKTRRQGEEGAPKVSLWEEAQAAAYALLAARRLGYSAEEAVEAVLGELGPDGSCTGRGVRILPVVVRPGGGDLLPHPLLASRNADKRCRRLKEHLQRVRLAAEFLAFQMANPRRLAGEDPQMFSVEVVPGVRGSILKLTPPEHGNPLAQDRWPCVAPDGKRCYYSAACRFYFGERAAGDDFERLLWGLRYAVYDRREDYYLTYRALYHAFRKLGWQQVVGALREGKGIVLEDGPDPRALERMYVELERRRGRYKRLRLRGLQIERALYSADRSDVYSRRTAVSRKHLDVLDEVRPEEGRIVGVRRLGEEEKVPYVFPRGQPVLLALPDAEVPTLALGVTGKIHYVSIEPAPGGGGEVTYYIGPTSRPAAYQMLLFAEYLRWRPELGRDVVMAELDVDLAHMELSALDALQRYIRRAAGAAGQEFLSRAASALGRALRRYEPLWALLRPPAGRP